MKTIFCINMQLDKLEHKISIVEIIIGSSNITCNAQGHGISSGLQFNYENF